MRNIIFTIYLLLASLNCIAGENKKPDSSETGAILIDFRKNLIIAERINSNDSFSFNTAAFDFPVVYDTTCIEVTKNDTNFWKIIVFKDWDEAIIQQAMKIDTGLIKIKQEKKLDKQFPVSLKCLDSPLVVKYDNNYELSFIGADFEVIIPGDSTYIANSALVFFSSSPYEKEAYKIRLFDDKFLVIGQVTGLLSEFKNQDERYIDHSHFFWAITK